MSSYLQHIRQMERADLLSELVPELAEKLKALVGDEKVHVSDFSRTFLTRSDIEEFAWCNDLTHDEACNRLALDYVEEWARYEWVNS